MTAPLNARSQRPSPWTAAGLLRISIDLRHLRDKPLDTLRRMVVADVLGRIHEHVLAGHVVFAALGEVAGLPSVFAQLARSCELELPSRGYESTAALVEALGGPPSMEVVSTDDTRVSDVAGLEPIVVRVGTVAATGLVQPLVERSTRGDPLALRFAAAIPASRPCHPVGRPPAARRRDPGQVALQGGEMEGHGSYAGRRTSEPARCPGCRIRHCDGAAPDAPSGGRPHHCLRCQVHRLRGTRPGAGLDLRRYVGFIR